MIDIPTERTTAVTDAILAVTALVISIYLQQLGQHYPWKAYLWAWAFGGLALAAGLGALAHGFKISQRTKDRLWGLLFLSLGLTVALFTVGAVFDIWGITIAQKLLPIMIAIGIGFFGVTFLWSDNFFIFIIYQALAMLFALIGYSWLALAGALTGAWLMAAGILVTMIAAGVQANHIISVRLIWEFDHNGVYHLIQIAGVILLAVGLRASLING